jgi:hypothetical protein
MLSSRILDYRIWVTFLLSAALAMAFNKLLPVFAKNPSLLFVLPAVQIFFLLLILKPKETFAVILFTRPFLDLFLDRAKMTAGGTQFSLGAFLNSEANPPTIVGGGAWGQRPHTKFIPPMELVVEWRDEQALSKGFAYSIRSEISFRVLPEISVQSDGGAVKEAIARDNQRNMVTTQVKNQVN